MHSYICQLVSMMNYLALALIQYLYIGSTDNHNDHDIYYTELYLRAPGDLWRHRRRFRLEDFIIKTAQEVGQVRGS